MEIRSLSTQDSVRSSRKTLISLITGIVTLLLIFSSSSAQELVYCSKYKDQEVEAQRSIVLVFSKERVRTFVYPIGYIWWEVTRVIDYNPSDKDITLTSCELELKSGDLKGYIKVDNNVVHLITVKDAGTLSITYTRRH